MMDGCGGGAAGRLGGGAGGGILAGAPVAGGWAGGLAGGGETTVLAAVFSASPAQVSGTPSFLPELVAATEAAFSQYTFTAVRLPAMSSGPSTEIWSPGLKLNCTFT